MVVYPTYFSPIIQYVALSKASSVLFEVADNYQKQTYRTRCYIYGANGKQLLNVPIKKANSTQPSKEVLIDNAAGWQQQQLKSIATAYRSSPFYEFYEDELKTIFKESHKFLLDLNFKCHDFISEALDLTIPFEKTTSYKQSYTSHQDLRFLADAKATVAYNLAPYTQVFSDKFGFIENLSVLDLLFMEGPNALNYLENQSIEFS